MTKKAPEPGVKITLLVDEVIHGPPFVPQGEDQCYRQALIELSFAYSHDRQIPREALVGNFDADLRNRSLYAFSRPILGLDQAFDAQFELAAHLRVRQTVAGFVQGDIVAETQIPGRLPQARYGAIRNLDRRLP